MVLKPTYGVHFAWPLTLRHVGLQAMQAVETCENRVRNAWRIMSASVTQTILFTI